MTFPRTAHYPLIGFHVEDILDACPEVLELVSCSAIKKRWGTNMPLYGPEWPIAGSCFSIPTSEKACYHGEVHSKRFQPIRYVLVYAEFEGCWLSLSSRHLCRLGFDCVLVWPRDSRFNHRTAFMVPVTSSRCCWRTRIWSNSQPDRGLQWSQLCWCLYWSHLQFLVG